MKKSQHGNPAILGVDWGTSAMRAYLMTQNGVVLDRVVRASGILNVPDGDFAFVIEEACGTWMERWPDLRILMCGMIGSRQGWREAPYLQGVAGPRELASALTSVTTGKRSLQIVPGIQSVSFSGHPDVMRGEETILVGAMALGSPMNGMYCLPGTHSKWVGVSDGRINAFSTFLTGEIYDLLSRRSVLSALMEGTESAGRIAQDAFLNGVDLAADHAALTHQLFSIRAAVLTGELEQKSVADTLSGLLIGAELHSVAGQLAEHRDHLILVASGTMADRYQVALTHLGFDPTLQDAEGACQQGLCAIAAEGKLAAASPAALMTEEE